MLDGNLAGGKKELDDREVCCKAPQIEIAVGQLITMTLLM